MIERLRKRIATGEREGGFTLIELLVVIIIIGILLAIAVPSYLGFRDRANRTAAQANVRSAVPAVEAYYADNGTYVGMDIAALRAIDAGVSVTIASVGAATYCIQSAVNGVTWSKNGPAAAIVSGACS
ncbi:MAG: prepilin-type N-terminal cleavage/methylation domain-containing protein [Thermoleophilia bacterium]|nr:prepilin-type N-terminal cleavage/methylation domain-containing protein [Thermoleophilia bacterium]